MIDDLKEAMQMVRLDGMNLRLLSDDLRGDKKIVMAAMNNCRYAFQFASKDLQKDAEVSEGVIKDDSYYYNMVDPRSGQKYDIPLLSPLNPEYYSSYIHFMKIKEGSPDTFEKVLSWD